MTVSVDLSPIGNDSPFMLATGGGASGYKLFTYTTGTTTKEATYTDNPGTTQNANPILLNSSGYPASGGNVVEIWLTRGTTYKFVLATSTDSDPPQTPIWTRDGIKGVNDVAASHVTFTQAGTNTVATTVQAKLQESVSFKDFGAAGDSTGAQGNGTDDSTAINNAIAYCAANGVTLRGTSGIYRMTTKALITSGLKLVMDKDCVIFMDSTTQAAWLDQSNWASAVALTKVWIEGGELRGRTDWTTQGHGIRIRCDNLTIKDTTIRYFGNSGLALIYCGNDVNISGIRAIDPYLHTGASGGIRCIGGSHIKVANCHVESQDDALQFVVAASGNTNGNMSISYGQYVNCTGISAAGKLCAVIMNNGGAGMTASVTDWSFVGISGSATVSGTGYGIGIINQDSTGTIGRGSLSNVHVDQTGSTTSAAAIIVSNVGTGHVNDIAFDSCSVSNPTGEAVVITMGAGSIAPKDITFAKCTFEGPTTSARCVNIVNVNTASFSGCHFTGCDTLNLDVVGVGTGSADCPNVHFLNCLIDEIGDTTAVRYGISWDRCSFGSSRGNTYVINAAATTGRAIKFASANATNITVDTDDVSQVTSTSANRITNASGTALTVRNCKGFVTRNSGATNIANGTTSKTVAHGLDVTPTLQQISFVFGENPTNDITKNPWIDTIGGTNFVLNVAADPGASNLDFGWFVNAEKIA